LLNRQVKGIWESETLSYFYAPFVQNLLKTYIRKEEVATIDESAKMEKEFFG